MDEEFEITYSWDDDILFIVISGMTTKENANIISGKVRKIYSQEKPEKVLVDCVNLDGRLRTADTYVHVRDHVREYLQEKGHRPEKVAILDRPENEEDFSFYSVTAQNVGLRPKFFVAFDAAVTWLQGE